MAPQKATSKKRKEPSAASRRGASSAAQADVDEAAARARGQRGPAKGRGAEAQKEAEAAKAPAPEATTFDGQYRVDLPKAGFEGPLDLLLHLIQQHELDILDIPIGFITERFLAYLKLMQTLSIDLASEYLVMAATLAHIKSKMLLPTVPSGQDDDGLPGEEEEDPRAELVRRLLEYQRYKAAAADLAERGTLGKDVFGRGSPAPVPEGPAPFASLGVFSLLDAFEKLLKKTKVKIDHEIIFDRISITDRIVELTERLSERRAMRFDEMIIDPGGRPITRFDIVITFLAVLEMARLRLVRVYQSDTLAPIHVEMSAASAETSSEEEEIAKEPAAVPEPPAPEAKRVESHEDEAEEESDGVFEEEWPFGRDEDNETEPDEEAEGSDEDSGEDGEPVDGEG